MATHKLIAAGQETLRNQMHARLSAQIVMICFVAFCMPLYRCPPSGNAALLACSL